MRRMKERDEQELDMSTKEYNMSLINKYIIRSKKVDGCLACGTEDAAPEETALSETYSSASEGESVTSEATCSSDYEDNALTGLNVYKNRRL